MDHQIIPPLWTFTIQCQIDRCIGVDVDGALVVNEGGTVRIAVVDGVAPLKVSGSVDVYGILSLVFASVNKTRTSHVMRCSLPFV